MSRRNRKRVVAELFHQRFYNLRFLWRSAEERAWLDVTPVGHEFGSPDYERLMRQDAEAMKAKLATLVAACCAGTSMLPEASEFWQDTIHVQKALMELGHDVSLDTAARLWKQQSSSLMASWMSGAQSISSARTAILTHCTTCMPRI
ncbi:MAG: hypothetical protein ABIZ09_06610 [Rhodoferax sp.]